VIFFAVVAAAWISRVVRQVRRDRRKPSRPGTADAYEGNLVVPVASARRHGIFTGHSSRGHDSGLGGHGGTHHGPGGIDGHGQLGSGPGHH
jgi:hypothetical protein